VFCCGAVDDSGCCAARRGERRQLIDSRNDPDPPQGAGDSDDWDDRVGFNNVALAPFLGPGTVGYDLVVDPATGYSFQTNATGCCTVTQLREGSVLVGVAIVYTPEPTVPLLAGLGCVVLAAMSLRRRATV